jgi:hypothetical protein
VSSTVPEGPEGPEGEESPGGEEGEEPEDRRPVPWTFKLMIVATVVYLGYRAYQGIAWVVHHA